ncbi:MAG TPA: hypothetical protein VNL91_01550 [Thermoanaerobaculia bacterium]|nr:hypothetical protein [Thermoanaerobaculia bacterium]
MIRPTFLLALLLLATAPAASARDSTGALLTLAWPLDPTASLGETGRGIGVVFSPDLSVPGNCHFYRALGFACFDDSDWSRVIDGIERFNARNRQHPIRTLLLETHGTNGHGLKLQTSKDPKAGRSYISVGALQERVEPAGVRHIIITACNSGRLLRPSILKTLDPDPGDELFLPATLGIHNASEEWDPQRSRVIVMTPATSRIEQTVVGTMSELRPATRRVLAEIAKERRLRLPKAFAVSDMLMFILLRDPRLELQRGSHVDELSKETFPVDASDALYEAFIERLDFVATRYTAPRRAAGKPGAAPKRSGR